MVGNIAIAIAMTDIPKPNHWKSKLQNVRYSNVFGVPMFGILAFTVFIMAITLLQINSRTQQPLKGGDDNVTLSVVPNGGNPGVADNWFTGASHRFCNVETRLFAASNVTPINNTVTSTTPLLSTKNDAMNHGGKGDDLDHPLAMEDKAESPVEMTNSIPKLSKVDYGNIALHLTPNDIDRIKIFIRE